MFQVILWDIDGTLLNFKMSERYALRKCFSKFHLGDCTDDMIARYSVINTRFWRGLEAGIYTKPQVLQGRFEEFFHSEGISFDQVSEFNDEYQLRLGDKAFFNDNGKELIQKLKEKFVLKLLEVDSFQKSVDGTIKYLFKLNDGHAIESVIMKYKYGNTACVSNQVGCKMGCNFCASARIGFIRILTPGEIVSQILEI